MIRYYLKNPDWSLEHATAGASGYDLRAAPGEGNDRTLNPGQRFVACTDLHLEMPRGVEAQVRSRSGLSLHHGIVVLNAPGTIDSDYRGEVKVTLINLSDTPWVMKHGDRIAQLVFAPVLPEYHEMLQGPGKFSAMEIRRVPTLAMFGLTDRGASGHGSTGR